MKVITIEVGNLGTNCYVVVNEETAKAVVIDPGGSPAKILKAIEEEKLTVEAIFLTHGHSDHILAVDEVRNATGAEVYIHKEDKDMLTDSVENLSIYMGMNAVFKPAEHFYDDGDVLNVAGMEFKVVHTPGHTAGGVCLICGEEVFCGDTVFLESIGRTDFPGGSYRKILRSIVSKILTLPDETRLYPGHGPSTTVGWERRRNPFLQMR